MTGYTVFEWARAGIATWLLCGMSMIFAGSVLADPPGGYRFLTYNEGVKEAGNTGKPVFVYFGRYGCGFCDLVNEQSFKNQELKKRYSNQFVLVYINSEGGRRLTLPTGEMITEMQYGERMNTLGTPVFVYLDQTGKEIIRRYGVLKTQQFLALEQFVSSGFYKTGTYEKFRKQIMKEQL